MTPPARPFNYGGQAVIEGVMMRGARQMAVAVRDPHGQIVMHSAPLDARLYAGPISRIPFVRGLIMLYDALGLGMRALFYSANVAAGEETLGPDGQPAPAAEIFNGPIGWGTALLSLTLSMGLFLVLPATIAGWIEGFFGLTNGIVANLIEGAIRLVILISYMTLIGQQPDVKRLYGYHGAEHKTINAYEAGAPLTPESVAKFPLEHPRCGTAFLLTVVLVSVILFAPLPRDPFWLRLATRILLIPVVAGIGYEILRFTARYYQNPLIRVLIAPNLALQRLTTREPERGMLEVAIAALERVLASEFATTPATTPVAPEKPLGTPSSIT